MNSDIYIFFNNNNNNGGFVIYLKNKKRKPKKIKSRGGHVTQTLEIKMKRAHVVDPTCQVELRRGDFGVLRSGVRGNPITVHASTIGVGFNCAPKFLLFTKIREGWGPAAQSETGLCIYFFLILKN